MSERSQPNWDAKYFSLGFWVAVALCAIVLWMTA